MNTDTVARYYEILEHLSFGSALERTRFLFLSEAAASRRAIVCGGGDGRFLARLLQCNALVEVDFVELSRKMIERADNRVSRLGPHFRKRVHFHHADLLTFDPPSPAYDLIATHFFLDCFAVRDLPSVVSRLADWAAPNALWMVSDFYQPKSPLAGLWTGAVIRSLYAAFRITTGLRVAQLPDYTAAIARRKYALRREQSLLGGLLHASLWQSG